MGRIIPPFRIKLLSKYINQSDPIRILDVGCGSNSPSITKRYFPNAHYTGIDIDKTYNNSQYDIECIDEFIPMDLNDFDEQKLQDNTYDVIILSHIIEHLPNGELVIIELLKKLKKGGYLYIEFPSEKSLFLPSMQGTLNFFDDPTHCRIYSIKEICNLIMSEYDAKKHQPVYKIVKVGVAKRWINILLLPVKIIMHLIKFGHCKGGIFWDITGFANFVLVRK